MLRIVERARPRAVLIENVRGLLTAKFAPMRESIDATLHRLGFQPHWALLNAVKFGVPQNRSRVFLIALRRGETRQLQWPFQTVTVGVTVGDAIGDLMAEGGWHNAKTWAAQASLPAPTIVGGSKKHGGPDLGPTRARREWAEIGVDGGGIANHPPRPPPFWRKTATYGPHGRADSRLSR